MPKTGNNPKPQTIAATKGEDASAQSGVREKSATTPTPSTPLSRVRLLLALQDAPPLPERTSEHFRPPAPARAKTRGRAPRKTAAAKKAAAPSPPGAAETLAEILVKPLLKLPGELLAQLSPELSPELAPEPASELAPKSSPDISSELPSEVPQAQSLVSPPQQSVERGPSTPPPSAVPGTSRAPGKRVAKPKPIRLGDALREKGLGEREVAGAFAQSVGMLQGGTVDAAGAKVKDVGGVEKLLVDILKECARHLESSLPPERESSGDAPVIVRLVHCVPRPARGSGAGEK